MTEEANSSAGLVGVAARHHHQARHGRLEEGVLRGGLTGQHLGEPDSFETPKNLWRRGRRRSHETAMTRLPDWASATARLMTVVVLPSPWPGPVTVSVCNPPSRMR